MKKLLNLIKMCFAEYDYTYYKQIYEYEGRLYVGYIVVKNHRFFWLPMHRRIAVCCDREELEFTLNLLKEFEK